MSLLLTKTDCLAAGVMRTRAAAVLRLPIVSIYLLVFVSVSILLYQSANEYQSTNTYQFELESHSQVLVDWSRFVDWYLISF